MAIDREAEKKAYQYFIKTGMTPQGACGLIGNLEVESAGFYPNRVEFLCIKRLKEKGKTYTDSTYTKAVDSGKISREEFLHPLPGKQYGYGLAQWTSVGRKAGLYDFAKKKGTSIGNLEMQLEYLVQELEKKYPSVYKVLKSTKSIQEASDIVLIKFEAPASGDKYKASRAKRGQEVYNYIKKNGSNSSSLSSSSNNSSSSSSATNTKSGGTCEVTLKSFVKGNKDNQIKTIQRILNALGYKGKNGKALTVDGEFGDNVEYAITKFQKDKKVQVNNYGTVGAKTWTALLNCA